MNKALKPHDNVIIKDDPRHVWNVVGQVTLADHNKYPYEGYLIERFEGSIPYVVTKLEEQLIVVSLETVQILKSMVKLQRVV